MDPNPDETPSVQFPNRMFAFGEEPVGIRVTPYHKPSAISRIINALEEDEIKFIRESSFGKLLEIAEKPSFSGRVGRFMISRQLKVLKKHELWFLFAGKPIRFSIREFALVTGLNCRNYARPSKKRSKKIMSEKPYWGELFGSMTEVPVSYVVTMLKRKTFTDSEIRIKLALLSLVCSVVLPTSHNPRILPEFVEKIKDIDQFLAFPWGRASFDMLVSSIKERNEVSLSQKTIAFKGFVMALQLVLIEAVPAITCAVRDGGSSASETESGDDEREGKKSINTVHVRDIDSLCKAHVKSIISAGVELSNVDLVPSEDEEDLLVDMLIKAIDEGFNFANSHFKGGVTKADVALMREEALKANANRKTGRPNNREAGFEGIDVEHLASIVKDSVSADLSKIGKQITDLAQSLDKYQERMQHEIQDIFRKEIAKLVAVPCNRSHVSQATQTQTEYTGRDSVPNVETFSADQANIIDGAVRFANTATNQDPKTQLFDTPQGLSGVDGVEDFFVDNVPEEEVNASKTTPKARVGDAVSLDVTVDQDEFTGVEVSTKTTEPQQTETIEPGLSFPDPSFSIGLTQLNKDFEGVDDAVQPPKEDVPAPEDDDDVPIANRKSKRAKIVPRNLVGDYQCDKSFSTRAWDSFFSAICSTPNIDYAAKYASLVEKLSKSFVIDFGSLILESRELSAIIEKSSHLSAKVMDVLFHHTRSMFSTKSDLTHSKNSVFLDTKFVSLLANSYPKFSKASKKDKVRFSAALCALVSGDCPIAEVIVLDCNLSLKFDASIATDLGPVSQMFPFILKQAGKQLTAKDMKPLSIDRPRSMPQNSCLFESGITSTLLTQAHAVGGVDVCKCITPEILDSEVQRLAVMMYEENVGVL